MFIYGGFRLMDEGMMLKRLGHRLVSGERPIVGSQGIDPEG